MVQVRVEVAAWYVLVLQLYVQLVPLETVRPYPHAVVEARTPVGNV